MNYKLSNILIIKLSAIGDVVHSLPFLEVLKTNYPQARINWLVEEEASKIIEGHPAIDQVIISRRNSWMKRLVKGRTLLPVIREVASFLREIRASEYDLVIDLQGLLKSGVLTGISRGNRKIGMDGAREGGWIFLNEAPVPVDYGVHAIDRYLKLAEYINCDITSWKGNVPFSDSDIKRVDDLLNINAVQDRPLVAINPMARWETKLWAPHRFGDLADMIGDKLSCEILFTGSEKDRSVIEGISRKMKVRSINLAGQTSLKELACLYTRCSGLVTTDTGPMHIGSAMGCRVVALFGPTAPWRTGPYGKKHKIIREKMECSPCFKKRCQNMNCMKKITVENVFEAVKDVITESQKERR